MAKAENTAIHAFLRAAGKISPKKLRWALALPVALMGAAPYEAHGPEVNGTVSFSMPGLVGAAEAAETAQPQEPAYPSVTAALQSCNKPATKVSVTRPEREPVIGVDYGHAAITNPWGARDMGAPKGPKFSTTELSVINSAGRTLEPILTEKGLNFTRTRGYESTDRFNWPHGYKASVAARGNVLYANGADVAVSLHADVRNPNNSGIHLYVWRPDVPGAKADPASYKLATEMARAFRSELGVPVSVMAQDFSILRNFNLSCKQNAPNAECPAVLVEIGNLHNRTDVSRMTSADWMGRFANTLGSVLQTEATTNENWVNDPPMQVASLSLNCSMAA